MVIYINDSILGIYERVTIILIIFSPLGYFFNCYQLILNDNCYYLKMSIHMKKCLYLLLTLKSVNLK